MKHTVDLSDNDILFMDDDTGNIVISVATLPSDAAANDEVEVHFAEDPKNIVHVYTLKEFDSDNDVATLDWHKQLGESLLTEAPLANTLERAVKKSIKQDKRAAKREDKAKLQLAKKLFKRDLSPEGRKWKFYIPYSDGKYNGPLDREKVRGWYDEVAIGEELYPEITNAIVTTESGFIVRRGLEDFYRKGVKLDKSNTKLDPKYSVPWPEADDNTSDDDDDIDFSQYRIRDDADDDDDSVNTDKQLQKSEQDTDSKEADDKDSKETSNTKKSKDKHTDTRYNLGISSNTYSHFLKLLYTLRPKVYDAFDKPLDNSKINTIKYNNLGDYQIDIDGKRVPVIDWIKTAVKNKVLTEKMLAESPIIHIDDTDAMNPHNIDFKDKIRTAIEQEQAQAQAAEKSAKEQQLRDKYSDVMSKLETSKNHNDSVEDTLEVLFEALVPSSGPADSVAGELVRAWTAGPT